MTGGRVVEEPEICGPVNAQEPTCNASICLCRNARGLLCSWPNLAGVNGPCAIKGLVWATWAQVRAAGAIIVGT